ncbi:sel1 repeat family protein [Tateyamaria omphalii]|uniref:tetratricopeptide repeat protein n=1 Tax=Tateyamaria omphalii TaxID=299262 RepID=UPI001C990F37|nr:tetratricopeptide repeat protein [Tateyamaria omphalii]MBY5935565.1 sel1 repeat family protein [Tateyamaria omphalii]
MIRALAFCLALILPLGAAAQTDLEAAARSGDTGAQMALAQRYLEGDGVLQNHMRAAEWLQQAAAAGLAEAQNRLGQLYFEGLGVDRDAEAALRWLEHAATSGDPNYLYDLALVREATGDAAGASALYERAADAGHLDAAVSLAVHFHEGTGRAVDLDRARALYEAASAQDHPRALNNLGLLYVRGEGVAQDYERAAGYFAQAATLGLRPAMTNLGVLYENGFGVPVDEAYAHELYRLGGGAGQDGVGASYVYDPRLAPLELTEAAVTALQQQAEAGDPVARFQMGWALVTHPERDFDMLRQAAALFADAAAQGHGPAMANLSLMYFRGEGQPQDYVLGQMWLLLAQRAGVNTAGLSVAYGSVPTTDQIAEAQRMAQTRIGPDRSGE